MAMATRNSSIWFELEGTANYGVDPTPTAADAMLIINPTFTPQFDMLEPEERPGTLGQHASYVGRYWSQLAFDTLLRSSGTAHEGTAAPKIGKLLRACGFVESTGGTGQNCYYRYNLDSTLTNHDSGTAYVYIDGILHELNGMRGTFNFAFDSGQIPIFSFTFKGKRVAASAVAFPANTFETTLPMSALSVALTNSPDAANTPLLHFEFDMGKEPVMGEDAKEDTGIAEFYSLNWNIKGNLVVEATPACITTLETELVARTGKNLIVVCDQSTDANEHCSFEFANVMWENYEWGDKDGIRTITIPFTAFESSGDDSLQIQFGAILT